MTHTEYIKQFPGADPDKIQVIVETEQGEFKCLSIGQARAGGYKEYIPYLLTELPPKQVYNIGSFSKNPFTDKPWGKS